MKKEKLSVITGVNLQQAVFLANKAGIQKSDFVGIVGMPNSGEFNIVYWEKYE